MKIFGKTFDLVDVLVFAFVLAFAMAAVLAIPAHAEEAAPAGSFYQWTDSAGAVNFSDSLKNIPSHSREKAQLRSFAEVRESTRAQITPMADPDVVRIPTLRPADGVDPMPLFAPAHTEREECDRPITVESHRVQQGSYNRTLYFVTNSCGEVISVTPQTPWVDVSVDGGR